MNGMRRRRSKRRRGRSHHLWSRGRCYRRWWRNDGLLFALLLLMAV
jgi:hypothetical protein